MLAIRTEIICLASAAQAEERVEPSIVVTGQRLITPDAVDARVSIERTPGAVEVIADTRFKIGRAHAELQSLMRNSYAVFCLKKKNTKQKNADTSTTPIIITIT